MDKKHWARMDCDDGGYYYYDADIAADSDVQQIMMRAQGNLTKEGYWKDVATDLATLVDTLKAELKRLRAEHGG